MAQKLKNVTLGKIFTTAIVSVAILFSSSEAFAAGSGYGETATPSAIASGFTNVIKTWTAPPSGDVARVKAYGTTFTVTVPAHTLPNGGQVVITAGPPSSIKAGAGRIVVADFSVNVVNPSTGVLLKGPFNPAITATFADSAIKSTDAVVIVASSGKSRLVASKVSTGTAVVKVTGSANLAVVR